MSLFAMVLLAQITTAGTPATPILSFPEAGLDDTAAYQGYNTRFYRDAAGNTTQIYLDGREGRVVHVLANSENESIGFSARDRRGTLVALAWDGTRAMVARSGRSRTLEYGLTGAAPAIQLGWFLLGSMRVERDFQYAKRHLAPFDAAPFAIAEIGQLLAALERLPAAERRRHLAALGAPNVAALRGRLRPSVTVRRGDTSWVATITQSALDGRDTLSMEVRVDPRLVIATHGQRTLSLRARSGATVPFTIRIATAARALTPLGREEIFTPEFLAFLASVASNSASPRARWLERQVRGVELLSSREKLMAGLPTYATYFGRDMLVTALMMRPIWRAEMSEFVVASVLRKLSPSGQVSHEEALGGQAVREGAAEYARLIGEQLGAARRGERGAADSLLTRARSVLGTLRQVRENYHMIDDEYQLPVLAGRWLADPAVPAERKRAFLLDSSDGGGTRLDRLLRELGLVARTTSAYTTHPVAANLVSFPARDSSWAPTSWRDSGAGYAGGRYAMDINALWVPHALEAIGRILATLPSLGFSLDSLGLTTTGLSPDSALGRYARDSVLLRRAVDAWRGASRHFLVRLGPAEVRSGIATRLAAMPVEERAHWTSIRAAASTDNDSLVFLALALDAQGKPIAIPNTDVATGLFLGDGEPGNEAQGGGDAEQVLRDVRIFTRAYPAGLLVERVGPVVANDAFAPSAVWRRFERDPYHGPRVVWGREVNLFLLGVARRIAEVNDSSGGSSTSSMSSTNRANYVGELRSAIETVQRAVEASGFRSELWSYAFRGGRPVAVRYGTGGDIQLWSTTDLVVQFTLSRLERR